MRNDLGPAAGVAPAARPRKEDQLESVINSENKTSVPFSQAQKNDEHASHIADGTALLAVYDGRSHIGFVYRRDDNSHQGFDTGAKTLGSFPTEAAAAAAVWRHAHGQEPQQ